MNLGDLQKLIIDVPDFPKKGIVFKDITPLLHNGEAFSALIQILSEKIPTETTHILAIESRGFILGAALAHHLNLGLSLVRKPGKLPREKLSHSYSLEYGEDQLEIHKEDLVYTDRVVVVDDVLATGGTASAVEHLCDLAQIKILKHLFLMEISALNGREKLNKKVESLLEV